MGSSGRHTTLIDHPPVLPGLAGAWRFGRLSFLDAPDGHPIPVRSYGAERPRSPAVICHGLHDHAGWYAQSAVALAGFDHPSYAYDRHGHGLSDALRGHCTDARLWLAECQAVVEQVCHSHERQGLILIGHGSGALHAATFACLHRARVQALVLVNPRLRAFDDWGTWQRLRLRYLGALSDGVDLRIDPQACSADPSIHKHIRSDQLLIDRFTTAYLAQLRHLERRLHAQRERLTMPIFTALADADPRCRRPAITHFHSGLPSRVKTIMHYGQARSLIEFSPDRERFIGDLCGWLQEHQGGA